MEATHYRVTVKVTATDATRHYTYTDAKDPAHAARMAKAEATTDYGFYNVGLDVGVVQVWDFAARAWVPAS